MAHDKVSETINLKTQNINNMDDQVANTECDSSKETIEAKHKEDDKDPVTDSTAFRKFTWSQGRIIY